MLATLGGVGAFGLAGCTGGEPPDPDPAADDGTDDENGDGLRSQNRYVTAFESEVRTLNPYRITDTTSGALAALTLDGSYTFDTEEEWHGRWIESVETDDDERYRITLRDNLQWSEPYGDQTAADWVFHVNEVVTHEANWAGHRDTDDWFYGGEPAVAEQVDELTFDVQLPEPDPFFVGRPGLWGEQILPKALVEPYYEDYQDGDEDAGERLNEDEDLLSYAYTGNLGPYTFVERRIEDRVIFERNEDYYMREHGGELWGDAPYFDEYVIRILSEQSTRLAELETGGITHSGLPSDQVTRFEETDGIDVVQNATQYCSVLVYNQRANGWDQLRVPEIRRAFSYAVDKTVIADEIYDGNADPTNTFQPEWSDYFDDSEVESFGIEESFDVERARTLLEEHTDDGYGYDGDTFVDPDGEQVGLTLVYPRIASTLEDSARYIGEQQFSDVLGFDVALEGQTPDTLQNQYMAQTDEDGDSLGFNAGATLGLDDTGRDEYTSDRAWDFLWGFAYNTYPRTPDAIEPFWTPTGEINYYGYHPSEDIGELLEEGLRADDDDRRREVFGNVFGLLSRDQPMNFVQIGRETDAYQEYVEHTEEPSLEGTGWGYRSQTWRYE